MPLDDGLAVFSATIKILGLLTPVELTDLLLSDPLTSFIVRVSGGADSFFDGGFGGRADVKDLRQTSLLLARLCGRSDVICSIVGLFASATEVSDLLSMPPVSPALVDLGRTGEVSGVKKSSGGEGDSGWVGWAASTSTLGWRKTGEVGSNAELVMKLDGLWFLALL